MRVEFPDQLIRDSIDQHWEEIKSINDTVYTHIHTLIIWNNPELAWHETTAHDTICDYFESLGSDYEVTRHAYGIETSFVVQAANPNWPINIDIAENVAQASQIEPGSACLPTLHPQIPTVVFNAEYDALPNMRVIKDTEPPQRMPAHACGHNLITSASVAGFIACWEALKASNHPGAIRLLGTPAEERGGGKLRLLKAGAYVNVDACVMAHPGPLISDPDVRSSAITKSLASQRLVAEFKGIPAHAGIAPWEGRNALDALMTSYVNITTLRQQLHPSQRINGIVTDGGRAANIIPDYSRAEFSIRGETRQELDSLRQRVVHCFHAGALATGCEATVDEEFTRCMNKYDFKTEYDSPEITGHAGAATDQGNVSHFVPAIEPAFFIDSKGAGNHTPNFTDAAGSEDAFKRALEVGMGLAALVFDVLTNEALLHEIKAAHQQNISMKADAYSRNYGPGPPLTNAQIAKLLETSMPFLGQLHQDGKISRDQAISALMATDTPLLI
ncbi:hypothetical protein ABW20_dc0100348 [Dactylellina cionopaga]|nr:hypothetical protein ABW20_dc0100348 [Dactylellina cionopaga]